MSRTGKLLIIACGAIARELVEVIRLQELDGVEVSCLPASLHNRPERIPDAVRARIALARPRFERVLVGYADCGTSGALDEVCEQEGVTRLPGAHCYELFAGAEMFARLQDAEPGTFYLTDYLAKNFTALVIEGLGIDRHPELASMYFGNYERLVYLAQVEDERLEQRAREAAATLGLRYERRVTGYGQLPLALASSMSAAGDRPAAVDRVRQPVATVGAKL